MKNGYIVYEDKEGKKIRLKAKVLEGRERYSLHNLLTQEEYRKIKHLGETKGKSTYVGMIASLTNEVNNCVMLLPNGKIVEIKFFARMDMDLVVKEAVPETEVKK